MKTSNPLNNRPALDVWGPVYRIRTSVPTATPVSRASKAACSGKVTTRHCLDAAEGPEPALVGALPGPLELVAKSLPFVKLPLPDLSPPLEVAHLVPRPVPG